MESTFIIKLLETAKRLKNKIAIIDNGGNRKTTYGELLDLSLKVAGFIKGKGIASGSFISVRMPSCMEYMAAEIGIWLSKCAVVPLGDTFPQQRVDYIVGHCECPLVIDGNMMKTISNWEPIDASIPERDDTALLMYTSGSTGNPKGVIICFDALDLGTPHIIETGKCTEKSIFGNISPFYFIAITLVYYALLAGATIHLYSSDVIMNPEMLADYISDNGITISCLTPALLGLFHNHSDNLKTLICVGDKLEGHQSKDGYLLYNGYGMTELAGSAILYEVPEKQMGNVPLGRPKYGVKCRVVGEDGKDVPRGEIGELYLKGHFCKEYFKDPEQTATLYQDGWLHTGDLVRQDTEGLFHYVNRKDNMVKLHGFRVEPGEVEIVIKNVPGVSDAVVKGFNNGGDNQYLCAYFVSDRVSEDELRLKISESLPEYMIPSFFVQLDKMPLSPNGKIDRKALPEPKVEQETYVAPNNETERIIAETIQSVLNLTEPVSVTAQFVAFGGDSIKAMQLVSELRKRNINITISQVLNLKTARALATQISPDENEDDVFFTNKDGYYHLNYLTRSMLLVDFGEQYELLSHVYSEIRFSGTDIMRLKNAVCRVIEAHPFLKARIEMHENEPMWHRDDERELKIAVENVDSFDTIQKDFKPYKLLEDDLTRITIYVSQHEMMLLSDFSHLILDGISIGLYRSEILKSYNNPELPISHSKATGYDLYAIEQMWLNKNDNQKEAETYFGSLMKGVVSAPYPYSRTLDLEKQSYNLIRKLENSREIEIFCKREGFTVNSYLLTTLLSALMRLLRQDNLMIFATSSGRTVMSQDILGNMARSLPVVGEKQWLDTTPQELIHRVEQQYMDSMKYEMYPINELVAKNDNKVKLHYTSEILSNEGSFSEKNIISLSNIIEYKGDSITFFSYKSAENNYAITQLYDGTLYSRRDMQALLDAWYMFAIEFCRETKPVNTLPIVTPEESKRILDLGDGNVRHKYNYEDYNLLPKDMTIVENVMRLAHEEPQKKAVIDISGYYTREQLNLYSNKVAHWLIAQNIPQNSVIGILTPRCKEYVALAFGVLKANCAIVALEDDYPEERRQQIIEEAEVPIVLTLETLQLIVDSDTEDTDICLCTIKSVFQIFFTSGSTGRPKGVVRTLAEMTYHMNNTIMFGSYDENSEYVVAVRFSFVACTADLWMCISHGNTIHIVPPAMTRDLDLLTQYVNEHNIYSLLMPASLGVMLINNFDVPLKHIFLAAEKIQPITSHKVKAINLYACTEVLWITSKIIHPEDTHLTAGIPQVGVQIYILDEHQNLLPQGVVGEICISATTMAKEYLNDPGLNARKFIPNPFCLGERLYRSGDLGYIDENGELNVVGRMDNMVKLHGFRIELDEISHAAMDCPDVDMCVCAKCNIHGSETLCLYYTSSTSANKETISSQLSDRLRSMLSQSLPSYMVPELYMQLDKMPLSPNGKIDRKALPEPEYKAKSFVLPDSEEEQKVLSIVEDMMGISPISVTDNLISLGLTSISVIRLSILLTQDFGKNINISHIMATPTVRDITAHLKKDDKIDVPIRPRQEYYPICDNLKVELNQLLNNSGKVFLNLSSCVLIDKEFVDVDRLRNAIISVIDATPFLKVRIEFIDGEYRIKRRDDAKAICVVESVDTMPDRNYFAAKIKPFKPLSEDWYRINITVCRNKVFVLYDILHILIDGLSCKDFFDRVLEAYESGKRPKLEKYTYYDYLLDVQENFVPREVKKGDAWYADMFRKCGNVLLIHDLKPVYDGMVGLEQNVTIEVEGLHIKEICKEYGLTEGNLFLTMVMMALQQVSGRERFMMRILSNERYINDSTYYKTLGYFLATTYVGIDHQMQVENLIADTCNLQSQAIQSNDLIHYPFSRMFETCNITEADWNLVPCFMYQDRELYDFKIGETRGCEIWTYNNPYAQDGLLIEVVPIDNESYNISLIYDSKYFSRQLIRSLKEAIRSVINAFLTK